MQALEEKLQRGLKEPRMPGLEYEVIVRLGTKLVYDGMSSHPFLYATRHQIFKIPAM